MLESGTSIKFKHISTNRMKIIQELLKNQRLLKYLTYLNDNPLSGADVNAGIVLKDNIVLTKFNPNILTETKILMFLTTDIIRFGRGRVTDDTIYNLDIVLPNDKWTIYSNMVERPLAIADEIAKSIDQQRVAGIGEVWISSVNTGKVNDDYAVLNLKISVANGTTKGV